MGQPDGHEAPGEPALPRTRTRGMNPICTGIIIRVMMSRNSESRNGNRIQASAYPARAAISSGNRVAGMAIWGLFRNAANRPWEVSTSV
jgi:hypothetical protein